MWKVNGDMQKARKGKNGTLNFSKLGKEMVRVPNVCVCVRARVHNASWLMKCTQEKCQHVEMYSSFCFISIPKVCIITVECI